MNRVQPLFWVRLLLFALTYLITAKLSLLLAIPPGFASPVWPAAGIALAGILLGGYRYLPGILLGSFVVNLSIAFNNGADITSMLSIGIASGIAIGASLQAAVSNFLIKRVVVWPTPLEQEKDIAMLLLLGGPISCLVNSIIGSSILLAASFISMDTFLYNMFTWWVGDTIGVIVVTPLIIVLATNSRRASSARKRSVTIPLFIIFSIVIYIFTLARDSENESIKQKFIEITHAETDTLKNLFSEISFILQSINQFYTASNFVDRKEFSAFTRHALESSRGLLSLSWVPHVNENERQKYEDMAHKDGLKEFKITELENNKLVPAATRKEYFPVFYISPERGDNFELGFNLASDPIRLAAMQNARDAARQIASASITLFKNFETQQSMVLLEPIYRRQKPYDTLTERRNNLQGFISGVIGIDTIMAINALSRESNGLKLHVYDNYKRGIAASSLYGHLDINAPFSHHAILEIAGRQWTLVYTPTSKYLQRHKGWNAWLVLVGGLLFTALLQIFLLVITARTEIVARLVKAKTTALASSELKQRTILESLVDAVITINHKGKINAFNAGAEKIFGWQASEVIGKNVSLLMANPVKDEHDTYLQKYTTTRKKNIIGSIREFEAQRKDGSIFPMELSVTEMTIEGKQYFNGVIRDITERKEAENKIRAREQALLRSNQELEKFAYIASHDLQEPLRKVQTFCDRLKVKYGPQLEGTGLDYIERMTNAAGRMRTLITDLLAFSRVSTKGAEFAVTDLNDVIIGVLDDLEIRIAETDAVIHYDELPTIAADALQMRQLFQNIIGNALKFQRPGVSIEINISSMIVEDTDVDGFYTQMCHITIADNGIGFEQQFADKIFDVFQRLHNRSEYEGTGVGLAICRRIAERHGGTIRAESHLNEGATFFITLRTAHGKLTD